jgi:hypothetical protein
LTLLALALPGLLVRFAVLPGGDGLLAPPLDDPLGEPAPISVFTLGLKPIVTAFLLVELLALSKPGWRRLRHGGPEGRTLLSTRATRLGVTLAAVQALAIVTYLQQWHLPPAGRWSWRLLVVFSLVAGTCVFVVLARLLDRFALGGGFSVLVVATALPALEPFATETQQLAAGQSPALVATVTALLLAAVATVFVLRRPPDREMPGLRGPACGIVPLQQAASPLALAGTLAAIGPWPALDPSRLDPWAWWAVYAALIALFAVLFGVLFNPPRQVALHDARGRGQVGRAVIGGLAYVLALAAIELVLNMAFEVQGPDLVLVAMVVAFGLDVVGEAEAFRRHPNLVAVWPEHRLYAVNGGLAVLEQAGIPYFARSVNHRALWHFFGPVLPIQLMVPADRAEEAYRLLHQHFLARSTVTNAPEEATA